MLSSVVHILAMDNENSQFRQLLQQHGIPSVLLRKLTTQDISAKQVILIDAHIDQRALCGFRLQLEHHLAAGGTVVFNGQLEYPVFHQLDMFRAARSRGFKDLLIERVNQHPVFHHVDCQDISIKRGVAGFYARGANPPPPGAIILHRLIQDHSPIDWVWQRPSGGQIFMHSGNNMWLYTNDTTSAKHIVPQLIDWALAGAPYNY